MDIEQHLVYAKLGNVKSMNQLGVLYRMGLYREDRFKNAIFWFEKAIKQGNTDALYNIGLMYEEGYGYKKNYTKAIEYYIKAANENNTKAMYALSGAYRFGRGVSIDTAMANSILRKCSELGDNNCALYLNLFR